LRRFLFFFSPQGVSSFKAFFSSRFFSALGIKYKTKNFPSDYISALDSWTSKLFIIFSFGKHHLPDKLFSSPRELAEKFLERFNESCVSKLFHLKARKYSNSIDYRSINRACMLSTVSGVYYQSGNTEHCS